MTTLPTRPPPVALASLFEGSDHEFQTEANGRHRAFGRVAASSRRRRRAIGGGAEDRAARTPDRVAAAAAQGNSGRARPNAKEDREVEAKVEAAPAHYSAPPPMVTKGPPPPPPPERVKVTLGGFVAAETVWRQHNMVNDIGTAFATTPYPFSPLYNEHEFHGTARQSRISLLVEGNIDPYQKLSGYYESDFLGVGNTSNYNQSNSWAARLRHAYFTYDNTGWGGWGFQIGRA